MRFTIGTKDIDSIEIRGVIAFYFLITVFVMIFEFLEVKELLYLLKPVLVPVLLYIYLNTSNVKGFYYIVSLFFALLANVFFISSQNSSITIATVFYVFSRFLVFYIVFQKFDYKKILPTLIGSIPFISVFLYLLLLSFPILNFNFYIFLIQAIIMALLGGYSVAEYLILSNKKNYFFILSCAAFSFLQSIYLIKYYYIDIAIFKPIAILLYSVGQYAFLRFYLLSEKID